MAAESPAFTGESAKLKTYLEGLFDASSKVNLPDAGARKAARDKIDTAMDWEQVAKDCLGGGDWAKASAVNRKTYQDLLRDVILKTSFTRLDTFWNGATYKFTKIDVKGNKAQATAVYTVKDDNFTLDYYLQKKGDEWKIYDIAFEDIRYSENIQEQIKSFLKEKGFTSLIAKLKKRRDELDESAKTKKS